MKKTESKEELTGCRKGQLIKIIKMTSITELKIKNIKQLNYYNIYKKSLISQKLNSFSRNSLK